MKNQKTLHVVLAFLIMSFFAVSCTDWVEQVDPLISRVEDQSFDNEDSIPFVLRGVKAALGNSTTAASGASGGGLGQLLWRIAGFSDEMNHDYQIKQGGVAPDHVQFVQDQPVNFDFYRGDWNLYHQIRFVADDLVERVGRIGSFNDDALWQEALWWGYMVGGLMRLYLAHNWGWDQNGNTPGAVISTADETGDLQSSSEITALAIEKFNAALKVNPGVTEGIDEGSHDRLIHSFMARAYLFDGQYDKAKTEAGLGLVEVANQNERLPLWERRRTPEFAGDFVLGYVQDKYTERGNNVEIIDWRENQLILAEVAIRDLDIATAVGHINNVRDYHGLTLTTEADLNNFSETKGGASTADAVLYPRAVGNLVTGALGYLIEERDKTLWMKGTRMIDQKRFDLWYLEVFTWSYQPIPTNESKVNPNLKDRARDL